MKVLPISVSYVTIAAAASRMIATPMLFPAVLSKIVSVFNLIKRMFLNRFTKTTVLFFLITTCLAISGNSLWTLIELRAHANKKNTAPLPANTSGAPGKSSSASYVKTDTFTARPLHTERSLYMEVQELTSTTALATGDCDSDPHISCFTSVSPAKGKTLVIPSTHHMQVLLQAGTQYTNGAGTIGTHFDFTAFVPDGMTSATEGHISLNHETTPGGISMLDVSFDPVTKLWVINESAPVDFSGIVGTQRNCSGGITPWGTVLTGEESRGVDDKNTDGYMDMGWLVEVDPVTRKVAEYGTGTPQKLWAVGNGSHENAAISSDSVTLYWGEDNPEGCIYKFVADSKMNLSSGTLYTMVLDNALVDYEPTSANGTWTVVPNTTIADRNSTYSLAKALGASIFNGVEDVEIGTIDDKIYFSAKTHNRVYRFKDNGATISEFETYVGGTSYPINTGATTVTENWGTGNDNLTFDDRGNLFVLQDGDQSHIWMVHHDHTQQNPKVEIFATTPLVAEPTGMTFSPDYKFMFLSLMQPAFNNNVGVIDNAGNEILFNRSTLVIIARSEDLGKPVISGINTGTPSKVVLYPNPTEGTVNVTFELASAGNVKVEVTDVTGRIVSIPVNAPFPAGNNQITFQLNDSGTYLVNVSTATGNSTYKVIVR